MMHIIVLTVCSVLGSLMGRISSNLLVRMEFILNRDCAKEGEREASRSEYVKSKLILDAWFVNEVRIWHAMAVSTSRKNTHTRAGGS